LSTLSKIALARARLGWLGAAVALGVNGACSLQTVEYDKCETNRDCAASFGLGSVCQSDGLCAEAVPHPRCTETYPADLFSNPPDHRDTVVFGSLFDLTNETHRARRNSIQLALEQINTEGGIEGRKFGLVSCSIQTNLGDSSTTTLDGALNAASYLTDTLQVPAVLGPASSGDVGGVFQQLRSSGTFQISPSATSPALTGVDQSEPSDDSPGLLWRTAPPDSLQGQAIAADMVARSITSVSVISQSGAYGEGLRGVFAQSFPEAFDLQVFSNTNQLTEAITAVGNGTAQEVLFIASTQDDVVTFLNASATNAGFNGKSLFLTDSAATQDTLDRGPRQLFSRIRGTRPRPLDTRDTVNGTFVASYAAKYQGANATQFSFTSHAYDMTWITALGAAWGVLRYNDITGLNIARGARQLSAGEEIALTPSLWNRALQHFRVGESINIRGASGTLDYASDTEETSGPIDVWYIDTSADAPRIATQVP
jgi:ABC-type branched-subunit amino acid transport system substrate-binding protein